MKAIHLGILRTIAKQQPVMIGDLHSDSELTYNTFANIITDMRDEGLIHKRGYKGPIWLTMRGSQVIESEVK